MSDYQFLVNPGSGINSTIEISRFIPNRKANTTQQLNFKLVIYTQHRNDIFWNKLDEVYFDQSNNIVLSSIDYNLDYGQIAVVIPCLIKNKYLNKIDILPEPISRKLDSAYINERASICFVKGDYHSSYQGEYPYIMSKIKGTFLTFNPLIRGQSNNVKTKLVFINIHSQVLTKKNNFKLNIANADDKSLLSSSEYTHNWAAIYDVELESKQQSVFYSKDTAGIPIFISYSGGSDSMMSVEHTHAPSEFFWGDSKFDGQKKLKNLWLSQLS